VSGRWIAVSTDLLNGGHELHPHSTGEASCKAFAWVDLIGMAAWKAHGGLRRGEVRASQHYLAARWNWSRSMVQRFLQKLESDGSISVDHRASRRASIITICNYEQYQTARSSERAPGGSAGGSASGSQEVPVPIPPQTNILPNALVGGWVNLQPIRPAASAIRKQGAAAKRICSERDQDAIELAITGIAKLFPYSKGEPWDLFDLERKFDKAVQAATSAGEQTSWLEDIG